jgi:hypothetical protein
VNQENAPGKQAPTNTSLQSALGNFLRNAYDVSAAAEDFISSFGSDDLNALYEHLSKIHRQPAAGWLEGYQATVTGIKANEAILGGKRIELQREWYEV